MRIFDNCHSLGRRVFKNASVCGLSFTFGMLVGFTILGSRIDSTQNDNVSAAFKILIFSMAGTLGGAITAEAIYNYCYRR